MRSKDFILLALLMTGCQTIRDDSFLKRGDSCRLETFPPYEATIEVTSSGTIRLVYSDDTGDILGVNCHSNLTDVVEATRHVPTNWSAHVYGCDRKQFWFSTAHYGPEESVELWDDNGDGVPDRRIRRTESTIIREQVAVQYITNSVADISTPYAKGAEAARAESERGHIGWIVRRFTPPTHEEVFRRILKDGYGIDLFAIYPLPHGAEFANGYNDIMRAIIVAKHGTNVIEAAEERAKNEMSEHPEERSGPNKTSDAIGAKPAPQHQR